MDDRFITVRTFDNPVEAHLAKNRLENAGLRAFLVDEITAGMAWYLSTAVGGIKLQTVAEDAERAAAILASHEPPEQADDGLSDETPSNVQSGIDNEESGESESEEPEEEPEATALEQDAVYAFRGAILGILFFPIQFYVFWLLLRILVSGQKLRGRYRSRVWVAGGICSLYMLLFCLFVSAIFGA